MSDLTPEKIKQNVNDWFYASLIHDEKIRDAFIELTLESGDSDEHYEAFHKFTSAVDYCLGPMGYGICYMEHKDGPVHIHDPRSLEESDSQSEDDAPSPQ